MASPQPDYFVKLSKELFDALVLSRMPATEKEIVWAVIRRTYGDRGRVHATVSIGSLVEQTGRDRGGVKRSLTNLLREGVLVEHQPPVGVKGRVLGLNKDYEGWGAYGVVSQEIPDLVGHDWRCVDDAQPVDDAPPQGLTTLNARGGPSSTLGGDHSQPIKDKTRQEQDNPSLTPPTAIVVSHKTPFSAYWGIHPKLTERQRAEAIWNRLSETHRQAALLGSHNVAAAVSAGQVEVQFVPGGAVFLCGKRWEEWENGTPAHLLPARPSQARSASQRALDFLASDSLGDPLQIERAP